MDYVQALEKRYSVKKFDGNRKVSNEQLNRILEAGRLSVSSLGLQPYKIIIVQSEEMLNKCVPAFYNSSQISTCSHLLLLVSKKNIDEGYIDRYFEYITKVRNISMETLSGFRASISNFIQTKDENSLIHWTEKQAYIVLGNLIFAAALENVDTCPMEGYDAQKLQDILEINSNEERISVALAIGYRAEDDVFQSMKKVRKPDQNLFKFI